MERGVFWRPSNITLLERTSLQHKAYLRLYISKKSSCIVSAIKKIFLRLFPSILTFSHWQSKVTPIPHLCNAFRYRCPQYSREATRLTSINQSISGSYATVIVYEVLMIYNVMWWSKTNKDFSDQTQTRDRIIK